MVAYRLFRRPAQARRQAVPAPDVQGHQLRLWLEEKLESQPCHSLNWRMVLSKARLAMASSGSLRCVSEITSNPHGPS